MAVDFHSLALQGVQALVPYQPGKPIDELERELGIRNSLKLASNENPLGPSPKAIAGIQNALQGLNIYPDGNGFALKHALAKKLGVAENCLTLGNGSNEILELVARCFLDPAREAVFSEHAFAVYPIVTQAVGATACIARANDVQHPMPYGHDLDAMLEKITPRTRVVFLANPNNPTGTWLGKKALEHFVAAVPKDVVIVLDEAYSEYVEEMDYPNTIGWIKRFPNLMITRTFSKIYGLAGLRIGYGISSEKIADLLNRVRQPFNTNTLAQLAATIALEDNGHIEKSVRVNREGLQQLREGFAAMGFDCIPSVANFITVNLRQSGRKIYDDLLREGVIVRPVDNYGLPGFLRITVGTAEQNARVLAAMQKVLAK
jgi:histidinol-phosphate aminotransferase